MRGYKKAMVFAFIGFFIGGSIASGMSKIHEATLSGNLEYNEEAPSIVFMETSFTLYNSHNPIYIDGDNDFTFENGVISGSGTSAHPYIIEGWDIDANSKDGIVVRNSNVYFVIRNCLIHNGTDSYDGIVFFNVTNGEIDNNIIFDNKNGVSFLPQYLGKENSENNTIKSNMITNNLNYGICFEHTGIGYHKNNIIFNNTISKNDIGIYMIMSAENTISSNKIFSNKGYGIQLDMCMGGGEYNSVYQNDFINNTGEKGQVKEMISSYNYWNNTYPKGGNYWNDYEGKDEYHGQNQDIPGSDGIGDTPYPIPDGYNEDRYPLITPYRTLHADANGPYANQIDEPIQFHGSFIGGEQPYNWIWDFGDGETSNEQNPVHVYTSVGKYMVTFTVIDSNGVSDSDITTAKIVPYDITSPSIDIVTPNEDSLYILGKQLPFLGTIIIGDLDIEINASDNESGIFYVELFINDIFVAKFTDEPYMFFWTDSMFGRVKVMASAFDNALNIARDEITVWKFF